MGANTSIQWTDATISPWDGCTKVGPGCDHCYAEVIADKRFHIVKWGAGQPRKWRESFAANAKKLERKAVREGRQLKVFISMCDPFDNEVPDEWRAELFKVILNTPHLTWQLLTKRISNVNKMLPTDRRGDPTSWGCGYPNVWIGATVVNQAEADRDIPKLLAVPAAVRFLSIEPMLGAIDLNYAFGIPWGAGRGSCPMHLAGIAPEGLRPKGKHHLHWVICGGESGKDARPIHPDWARSLRDQCSAAGVPFFFKQWGEWIPWHRPSNADEVVQCAVSCGNGRWVDTDGSDVHGTWNTVMVQRVGTKAAGNLLDGVRIEQFPDHAA